LSPSSLPCAHPQSCHRERPARLVLLSGAFGMLGDFLLARNLEFVHVIVWLNPNAM
jgi:hypothetical protein